MQFVSTTPHRLRKRLTGGVPCWLISSTRLLIAMASPVVNCWYFCVFTAPSLRSDSDSELSASDSGEEEDGVEEEDKGKTEEKENVKQPRTPSKPQSAALYKTPAKKSKSAPEILNQVSVSPVLYYTMPYCLVWFVDCNCVPSVAQSS